MHHIARRLAPSRIIDKPRRARHAIMLAVAAVLGMTSTALAVSGPAEAATTYREYENNSSQFKLVMTARGTTSGSPVGLSVDNNSSDAQWRREFLSFSADGFPVYRYVLRASEPTGNKCLDVKDSSVSIGATIVVQPCDGRASQRWARKTAHIFGGVFDELRNEKSGLFVARASGPEFTTNLIQNKSVNGSLWTPRVSLVVP